MSKQALAKHFRKNPTEAEERLWQYLRGNRTGFHFRRQHVLQGFIVDFYCHRARLIVEVDGPIHEEHNEADAERDRILESHGYSTLRLENEAVFANPEICLDKIQEAMRQRS